MRREERIRFALSIATDTKEFIMGEGVSEKAPSIFRQRFPGRKALILSDVHTWPALGEKLYGLFRKEGIPVEKYIIGMSSPGTN